MKHNPWIIAVSIALASCVGSSSQSAAISRAISTSWQKENLAITATISPSIATPTPTIRPTNTQSATTTPVPTATPYPLANGSISEGLILFNPNVEGMGSYEVVYQFQQGMTEPETFLSEPECCVFVTANGNQMMSPDHRYVAIVKVESSSSSVAEYLLVTDGKQQWTADMKELQALDVAYWPNNHQIFLYPADEDAPNGELLLYDPFTQQLQIVDPTFPNFIQEGLYRVPNWSTAPEASKYDPSLSLVVYYEVDYQETSNAIVLWDLKGNTVLWRRTMDSMLNHSAPSEPEWSPDGSHFVILMHDVTTQNDIDMLLVDRNGNETILSTPEMFEKITWGGGIAWSPDGRYISFYVQDTSLHVWLLIYDLENGEIWDPAIVEANEEEMRGLDQAVIWSPDSQQFLVNNVMGWKDGFAYLVDVEKKEIYDFGHLFLTAIWLAPAE